MNTQNTLPSPSLSPRPVSQLRAFLSGKKPSATQKLEIQLIDVPKLEVPLTA
jgi:hypothetical protein